MYGKSCVKVSEQTHSQSTIAVHRFKLFVFYLCLNSVNSNDNLSHWMQARGENMNVNPLQQSRMHFKEHLNWVASRTVELNSMKGWRYWHKMLSTIYHSQYTVNMVCNEKEIIFLELPWSPSFSFSFKWKNSTHFHLYISKSCFSEMRPRIYIETHSTASNFVLEDGERRVKSLVCRWNFKLQC